MPSLWASHFETLGLASARPGAEAYKAAEAIRPAGPSSEKRTLLIQGATGPDAHFINGMYDLTEPGFASPAFRARKPTGRTAVEEFSQGGIWLYRATNNTWCISTLQSKDIRSPICWAYKSGDLTISAEDWQVAAGDAWQAQTLGVSPMSSSEASSLCKKLAQRASDWAAKNSAPEVVALPYDALSWSEDECDLWFRTSGRFHPRSRAAVRHCAERVDAATMKKGRVTVITPTTESRQGFHDKLWACFEAQEWADKEIIVVETYQRQSSAFLEARADADPRLTFISVQLSSDQDWSIGLKRNIALKHATGEYVAHFDDDDIYAVSYLPRMIQALRPHTLLAKLSTWYIFNRLSNTFGFCDPEICGREQQLEATLIRQRVYGYGFSYVYRREVWQRLWFEDVNFGEDFKFVSALMKAEGASRIALVKDESGICMHMQHGQNTSEASCVMLKSVPWEQASDLDFADIPPVFDCYFQDFALMKERGQVQAATDDSRPLTRRLRDVVLHAPVGTLDLRLPAGALGSDVLAKAEESYGCLPIGTQLWWLPPPWEGTEQERHYYLCLAISSLVPGVAQPGSYPSAEHRNMIERIHGPVPDHGRIGAHTTQLWLSVPGQWASTDDLSQGEMVQLLAARTSPFVRVHCSEMPNKESVSSIFHVDMPMDATVEDLRRVLGARLPEWAEVLAPRAGQGQAVLADSEFLPDKVTISDFAGTVTADMMLTKDLCREFMQALLEFVQSAKIQQRLDKFAHEVKGDDAKYRMLLAFFLLDEAYPEIATQFGLPRSVQCMKALKQAIEYHMQGDLGMYVKSVELEGALRNWTAMEGNQWVVERLMAEQIAAAHASEGHAA